VLAAGSQTLSVTFTPTDTTAYNSATGSVILTVNQATPAIAWATPAPITYGTALSSAQLDAVTTVAGGFSYSPSLGQILPVGNQMLSVTFTPTDTADYTSATGSVTLSVTKPATAISWEAPTAITYGTALGGTELDATANVPGSFSYTPAAGTVLEAGAQTLSVTFTPTDTADYQSAADSVTLTVNQATPAITWAAPTDVVQGTALSSTQLDATANVAGSFSYTPPSGTALNTPGTQSLSVTFTPTDTKDYTMATAKESLIVIPASGAALVDFGTTEQTIRGFGGSTAWLGQLTTQQAAALFSPTSGLGLSILRMRIDPTGTAATNWVPANGAWAAEVANAQEAIAANPNAIAFASPWTPPAPMKTDTQGVSYTSGNALWGGSLNTASYADYAKYLEDFVTYFNANAGFDLYAISMQNEPDWDPNPGYESCIWTADQMKAWIKGNASVLTTKLIMPESANFDISFSDDSLEDSTAEPLVSIIGGHLYGGVPPPTGDDTLALQDGKELWMTEHYLNPSGANPTIGDAITAAEEVHDSLATLQYSAYVWWWIWDDPNDGVNFGLIDSNTTSPTPTYFGYGIGQFSKFIQPGDLRVSATANPVAGVYLSAYGGNGKLVIVAINSNATAASVPVYIEGQSVNSLTPYQTSASAKMAELSAVSASGNQFTYSLPAQSITTFVATASAPFN
jgi:glucuronoarabinoxylan endo-1,4-beta-xylanase